MPEDNTFYLELLDHLYDGVFLLDRTKKITYWNNGAEKLTGYEATEVIGKCCSDNILMHVNDKGTHLCKNLCPAEKTITDGELQEQELYIHHKSGYRVPVLTCTAPIKDTKGDIIGVVNIFSDNSARMAIMQRIEELQEMALSDPLTSLGNRRYAEMSMNSRLDELHRYGWTFGVLFFDMDNFKKINDIYGHDVGDRVLKMIAGTLSKNIRSFDTVNRWGGEEFVAVVVNIKEDQLYAIADKLRVLIEQSSISVNSDIVRITASVGATLVQRDDTVETIVRRADSLMYRCKAAGGNPVSIKLEE